MKRLKKIFSLCLFLIIMFLNMGMAIAEPTTIEVSQLETEIMPEYDTPEILIINAIKFINRANIDFSGDLKWRIPKGAFKQIVTENADSNSHLQFKLIQGKDYDEMVWKLAKPLKPAETKEIHLEFYYNNFKGNPDKQFSFDLNPPYPVVSGQLFLLQPLKATNFKVTPEFGQPLTNQEWTYYTKSLSNLPQDQALQMVVSYTKTDTSPSVTANQQPGQAQNKQTTKTAFPTTHKILIFAVAAIAIIITAAAAYLQIQKNKAALYDQLDDFEEEIEEEQDDIKSVPNWLDDQKRQLLKKFEEGRIIEHDYYDAVLELEEKAKQKNL